MHNRRRPTRAPHQPITHWTGILSRVLHEYDTLPTPTNVRINATLITGLFTPAEVSPSPDERLFILTAYDGVGLVLQYGAERAPSVRRLFEEVIERYEAWDTEGAEGLTQAGKARAFNHLCNLLR